MATVVRIGIRVTAIITNIHANPTHFSTCPVCGGSVVFNMAELEARRAAGQSTSIYCAGNETPTTGGNDPHNHWHPGFPPDPHPFPTGDVAPAPSIAPDHYELK